MAGEELHDVVIVGAGVAGVNCALECFDIQLDTVIFEAGTRAGGQLPDIPFVVRNVATGTGRDGPALRDSLEEAAAILGDRMRRACPVTRVDLSARQIEAGGASLRGRALVIATGTALQELPAAPDGAFGGDVTYLLEARPRAFVGRDVVVIGGGDSGTLDALALVDEGAAKVWLVHRSPALTARHDIAQRVRAEPRIELLAGWELERLDGDNRLARVTVVRRADGQRRQLGAGGLVVKIARVPCTDLFRGQLETDHEGAIVVDQELRTSRDGVFAAGDVVAGTYARVAAAMGQGSLAARSVLRYLQGEG
jgi:thioredoxin reductase (NADPH)